MRHALLYGQSTPLGLFPFESFFNTAQRIQLKRIHPGRCAVAMRFDTLYNLAMEPAATTLDALNARIVACNRCPRLREHCMHIAQVRRRAYADWEYWGKPVPSFGDPQAHVLILGLAPGAHGSNRTGRPFTGDGSGDFLFPILHEVGFASQPLSRSRDDGMVLKDLWITSVGRCAPPANKPTSQELSNCAPWLDEEIRLLRNLRVVVCLGRIAFDGLLAHGLRNGTLASRSGLIFRHGAEYTLPSGLITIASYHPSLQNTNTGKLTRAMFRSIFERAKTATIELSAKISNREKLP